MENVNLKEKKERIWYWDTVKFLMILAVVIGHCIERMTLSGEKGLVPLNLFIYTFHMPMFLFIFGVFHNEKNTLRKLLFYFTAGYLLKVYSYFSSLLINGKATFIPFYNGGVPWFMFVLAWYTLIAWLLRKVDKRIVLAVSVVIPLITGYFNCINDFLCLSRMFVYFPFFWIGKMLDRDMLLTTIRKWKRRLFVPSVCLLSVWLILCIVKTSEIAILSHLFTGRNPFSPSTHGLGFLYRLLTDALTFLTGAAILFIVPERKIPLISYMGRNTVNVYFWHYSMLYLVFRIISMKELIRNWWGVLIVLCIGVALTFILSLDLFNFPLKYINRFIMTFKPKKSISTQ